MPELIREPLYQQIVELLRGELAQGQWAPESRFPSERELAARFAISRTTANKVLSVLAADGLVQHRKGLGAFVAGKPLQHDMGELLSFTEKARRSGFLPETRVLAFRREEDGAWGQALYLERLRSVDGEPVIFERRWLNAALCPGLTEEMAAGSLYDALINGLGLTVACAEQRARAVAPDGRERALLGIRQGQACLRVEGRGLLADGQELWREDTLFRGDRYEIHGVLTPAGSPFGRYVPDETKGG